MKYHLFVQTRDGALDYRGSFPTREEAEKRLLVCDSFYTAGMVVEEVAVTKKNTIKFADAAEVVRISDQMKVELAERIMLEERDGGHA